MLSSEQIKELSKLYKIDSFTVGREYAQIIFLEGIYSQPQSLDLVFKGGTCLRLIYGGHRFSEDLDFTLVGNTASVKTILDTALKFFNEHFPGSYLKERAVDKNAPGYTYLLKFSLPDLPFEATLHLDFSIRGDVFAPTENRLVQVKGYPLSPARPLIKVLSKKELLAEKIRAFLSRDKLRDLYDLAFLLNDTEVDLALVSKKTAYYQKEFNIKEFMDKLNAVNVIDLKKDLTKFLPLNERGNNTFQNVVNLVRDGFKRYGAC